MDDLQPILVAELFAQALDALLELLGGLTAGEWERPTGDGGWTVHETALHLLGGDVGILSGGRDTYGTGKVRLPWDDLVRFINEQNDRWVGATRRISPRLLIDLLRLTGEQVTEYFASLDPFATGGPVDWAGSEPAPVWLDLAREYTERWHHQQQIRDAVGRPGLRERRFFAPVLDAFCRALPHAYREIDAAAGTLVALTIGGDAGGAWRLRREPGQWRLTSAADGLPAAEVVIDQDIAWRLFTKGISAEQARAHAVLRGDQRLGEAALRTISVIA